jgi:hypothetical protein
MVYLFLGLAQKLAQTGRTRLASVRACLNILSIQAIWGMPISTGTSLGPSLLSQASDSLAVLDPYFQIHPFVAYETTPRGNIYGFGGLIFAFLIGRYFVILQIFCFGDYSQGDGKRLGSPIEFRSTSEGAFDLRIIARLTV